MINLKSNLSVYLEKTINKETLIQKLKIEAEIALSWISSKNIKILTQFGPHGPSNMKPVFVARSIKSPSVVRKIGKNQEHIRFQILEKETSKKINVIGFGMGKHYTKLISSTEFDCAFTIEEKLLEWYKVYTIAGKRSEISRWVLSHYFSQNYVWVVM